MSVLSVVPDAIATASANLANLGSTLRGATGAAATQTTAIAAPAADEVSAAITALFGANAQEFQALSAEAATFNDQFVSLLNGGAAQYVNTEIANAQQTLANAVNTPAQALLSHPLIGTSQWTAAAANPAASLNDVTSVLGFDFSFASTKAPDGSSKADGTLKVSVPLGSVVKNLDTALTNSSTYYQDYINTPLNNLAKNPTFVDLITNPDGGPLNYIASKMASGYEAIAPYFVDGIPFYTLASSFGFDASNNFTHANLTQSIPGGLSSALQYNSGGVVSAKWIAFGTGAVGSFDLNPLGAWLLDVTNQLSPQHLFSQISDYFVNGTGGDTNSLSGTLLPGVTGSPGDPQSILTQLSSLPTQLQTQLLGGNGFGISPTFTSDDISSYGDNGIQRNVTASLNLNAGPLTAQVGIFQGVLAVDSHGFTGNVSATVFGINQTVSAYDTPGGSPQFSVSGGVPGVTALLQGLAAYFQ